MSPTPSERNATFQLKRALKAEDECRALQARVAELTAELANTKEVEFPRRVEKVAEGWKTKCEALQARVVELGDELERERICHAACGVIALSNTPESAATMRQMKDEYRSASVQDVCNAVDREMALRVERDSLAAELAAARAQEPVSHRYRFTHPISGEPVWRDSSPTWNGQCVQEVQPLFAAPVPPVREPLSDAQINEIRLVHGVTSSGRGIREVAQVISFARAIEAAIKEQKC